MKQRMHGTSPPSTHLASCQVVREPKSLWTVAYVGKELSGVLVERQIAHENVPRGGLRDTRQQLHELGLTGSCHAHHAQALRRHK